MALIFPRLAQNFVKNGYYPTDEVTLSRILNALDISGSRLSILDPCCGEGVALSMIQSHLTECGAEICALGVEYDQERAWHAKGILNKVLHSDVNDVHITARSQSLLFLNPPYGDVVSDKAGLSDAKKTDRLEKIFYRKTLNWLQFDGVLVLLVPYYVLDKEFSTMIARNFCDVRVFMAPEQQFKQCVVFGIKKRSDIGLDDQAKQALIACGQGQAETLPEVWQGLPYDVPNVMQSNVCFQAVRIDAPQLEMELMRMANATLWPQFDNKLGLRQITHRAPLRQLSDWHLALALSAGQITGVVESSSGRRLLIQGDTIKVKTSNVVFEENADGSITETQTLTDKFVPAITGIDLTHDERYGSLVSIR